MELGGPQLAAILVAIQRLGELWLSRRNERRLRAAGAVEHAAGQHRWFVALHAAWLAALFLLPADRAPVWPLVAVFLALQAGRGWVIASLGRYWTTRVLTLPEAPLVRRGPYALCRHPNYWIVLAEIVVLPLAFSAWGLAAAFGAAQAALLAWRIRAEDRALAPRRTLGPETASVRGRRADSSPSPDRHPS